MTGAWLPEFEPPPDPATLGESPRPPTWPASLGLALYNALAERDRARATAVLLEQQLARVQQMHDETCETCANDRHDCDVLDALYPEGRP